MDNCILCGQPDPQGLCEACIRELFGEEPALVTSTVVEEREFFSSLEDADSAGYPECYF